MLYEGQLITKEDLDYYKSKEMFKNYVPLKGLPGDDTYFTTGQGFSVTGKDLKRAGGRKSRATNPFIQVMVDYGTAVQRAEKNKVAITFHNMLKENPSEMWDIKGVKHIPRYDKNGELQYLDPMDLKPKEFEVKINGKRKIITINDPELLNSMKKIGSGRAFKFLTAFNNFFRAINTVYSPRFIVRNFQRDLQTGLANLSADHKGVTLKTVKNIPFALKGIYDNLSGKDTEGARLYQEFKDNGGIIGWFNQMSVDEKIDQFKKVIKNAQSKNQFGIAFRALKKIILDLNEVVESGIRLATYKTLTESGMSQQKTALYAKNLTVNFNRKGLWGPWLNSLYVFSNASIQGNARTVKMYGTKRGKKIALGFIVFGFLQSLVNRMIDEEDWENTTDYNKDSKWMYNIGNGEYIYIMAPWGLNIFKTLGATTEEMINGDTTFGEFLKRNLHSLTTTFNPLDSGSLFQMVSPTITDPIVQITENKKFHGGPIMPEQPAYGPKKSNNKLFFTKDGIPTVRKPSLMLSKFLNKVSGGTDKISGYVDISPEILDQLIDSYTGGIGREVSNFIGTGTSLFIDGKLPPIKNRPIESIYKTTTDHWVANQSVKNFINESERTLFNSKQRKRFMRQVNYLKKNYDYDKERFESRVEYIKFLDKKVENFIEAQIELKLSK